MDWSFLEDTSNGGLYNQYGVYGQRPNYGLREKWYKLYGLEAKYGKFKGDANQNIELNKLMKADSEAGWPKYNAQVANMNFNPKTDSKEVTFGTWRKQYAPEYEDVEKRRALALKYGITEDVNSGEGAFKLWRAMVADKKAGRGFGEDADLQELYNFMRTNFPQYLTAMLDKDGKVDGAKLKLNFNYMLDDIAPYASNDDFRANGFNEDDATTFGDAKAFALANKDAVPTGRKSLEDLAFQVEDINPGEITFKPNYMDLMGGEEEPVLSKKQQRQLARQNKKAAKEEAKKEASEVSKEDLASVEGAKTPKYTYNNSYFVDTDLVGRQSKQKVWDAYDALAAGGNAQDIYNSLTPEEMTAFQIIAKKRRKDAAATDLLAYNPDPHANEVFRRGGVINYSNLF